MLSWNQIHSEISLSLNTASLQYRDTEPEWLDIEINAETFKLFEIALDKPKVTRLSIEKNWLRDLVKINNQVPKLINEEYVFTVPNDYRETSLMQLTVYDDCCDELVTEIKLDVLYIAITDVQYAGKWYKKDELFTGTKIKKFYGSVKSVQTRLKQVIDVDKNLYDFHKVSSTPIVLIDGNVIKIKSKYRIYKFTLSYIADLDNTFKIDSFENQTLDFEESIQKWIIGKVIERLSIRLEEPQQKIVNLKQEA